MNNQSALDKADIEESVTTAEDHCACEACGGKGWLLANNLIGGSLEIQRCDSCDAFITDDEARGHIINGESALVEIFRAYCAALLAKTEDADTSARSDEEMAQTIRFIRDSLRNAMALFARDSDAGYPANLRCAYCKQTEAFYLETSSTLLVHKDGTVLDSDEPPRWSEHSFTSCRDCSHCGALSEFRSF